MLLIETDNSLVLVDSGFGTDDCANPKRVGPTRRMVRPVLRHEETVAHQIEQLGFARDDVRHIIITHMDMDHAGGLSDFSAAQIHLTSAEALGAIRAPSTPGENPLPIRAVDASPQHRRARSARREVVAWFGAAHRGNLVITRLPRNTRRAPLSPGGRSPFTAITGRRARPSPPPPS